MVQNGMCNFQIKLVQFTEKKNKKKVTRVETDLSINIPLLNNLQHQHCPLR